MYRTPSAVSDKHAGPWLVEHRVLVSPWLARFKPAFDVLRKERDRELTKSEFLELCPRALPESVDGLFHIFNAHGSTGNTSYFKMCAFLLFASDGMKTQDKLEALFPIVDTNGDHFIDRIELETAMRMLYYARFRDDEFSNFKVQEVVNEAVEGLEADDKMTLREFTLWVRTEKPLVKELRELLSTPLTECQGSISDDQGPEMWTIQAHMNFDRIKVENPIVELDGDEMARVLWQMIKDRLIYPFLDMDIDYYDLSITYRDETDDQVTADATHGIQRHNVGIKCATIAPDADRVLEFNLQQMWPSPNSTIRNILDGTVFHAPIIVRNIPRLIPGWKKPIIVGRHPHGDQYKATELRTDGSGAFKVSFTTDEGQNQEAVAYKFKPGSGGGVMLGMYNTRESIENFAKSCFEHALDQGLPLYLSTKADVLQEYDGIWVEIFANTFENHFKHRFEECGLWYQHRLLNDMVSQVLRSDGGFVWACKNYDGDLLSDVIAQGFGSYGLMFSTLVCSDGKTLVTEAAHGTVTRHYRALQSGETTSTNPMPSIFAWSRGLAHRAKLDGNHRLAEFSSALEEACITCVERGLMSKDLASCMNNEGAKGDQWLHTEELLNHFANELRVVLSKPLRERERAQAHPFGETTDSSLDRTLDVGGVASTKAPL